jgi:hypothetical protein
VHREALNATEHLVNAHVARWRTGAPTPAGPALDAMYACWQALPVGEELQVDWPDPTAAPCHQGWSPSPLCRPTARAGQGGG